MTNIAVLMTSHNRREKTVACVQSLQASATAVPDLSYHVFLVDDGSTDGTAEAVAELGLPVTIMQGDGDLFWNRGMVRAWQAALEADEVFDGYVLLNDDTVLDPHALSLLGSVDAEHRHSAIAVGAVRDPTSAHVTYGGVVRTSHWHPGRVARLPPCDRVQAADTFNANVVYVPASVSSVVGTLDPTFQHAMGDFDYGFRAREHGFAVVVAPGTLGTCSRNDMSGTWVDARLPIGRRLALLASPKGLPRREWAAFLRRHGAPAPGLLAWVPTLRVIATGTLAVAGRARSRGSA